MPAPLTGRDIQLWRVMSGLTQRQAAAKLGVSVRTLEDWELGRSKPHPYRVGEIKRRMRKEGMKNE